MSTIKTINELRNDKDFITLVETIRGHKSDWEYLIEDGNEYADENIYLKVRNTSIKTMMDLTDVLYEMVRSTNSSTKLDVMRLKLTLDTIRCCIINGLSMNSMGGSYYPELFAGLDSNIDELLYELQH
jgi:hypothetical protein